MEWDLPTKILDVYFENEDDGTFTRLQNYPETPPSPDPTLPIPVLSKDLTIDQSKHTWARIYLPRQALNTPSNHPNLPLIVFYYGSGFIFYHANSTYFHDFCVRMANATQSVVVSVDYRLAPEHRLLVAYEDSVQVLHWIRASNDLWLSHTDFSRCYLMGESAGGNIAYNAGLRAAAEADQIRPLKIKGMILIQPFFEGKKRIPSELRLAKDLKRVRVRKDDGGGSGGGGFICSGMVDNRSEREFVPVLIGWEDGGLGFMVYLHHEGALLLWGSGSKCCCDCEDEREEGVAKSHWSSGGDGVGSNGESVLERERGVVAG
ncbi:hypothetical protein AHAS_Ahas20G0121500 [Arachis hypogaea]